MKKIAITKKTFPLRLPDNIKTEAQETATELGISLNSLIALAVNRYIRNTKNNQVNT